MGLSWISQHTDPRFQASYFHLFPSGRILLLSHPETRLQNAIITHQTWQQIVFFYAIRKSYWKPKLGLTYSSGSTTATGTTSTPSSTELCPHPMPQRGGIFHLSHSRYVSGTKITTLSAVSLQHGIA